MIIMDEEALSDAVVGVGSCGPTRPPRSDRISDRIRDGGRYRGGSLPVELLGLFALIMPSAPPDNDAQKDGPTAATGGGGNDDRRGSLPPAIRARVTGGGRRGNRPVTQGRVE